MHHDSLMYRYLQRAQPQKFHWENFATFLKGKIFPVKLCPDKPPPPPPVMCSPTTTQRVCLDDVMLFWPLKGGVESGRLCSHNAHSFAVWPRDGKGYVVTLFLSNLVVHIIVHTEHALH